MEAMTAPTSAFVLSQPQHCLLARAEKPATTRRALLIGPSHRRAPGTGATAAGPSAAPLGVRPSRVRPCHGVAEAGVHVFPDPALYRSRAPGAMLCLHWGPCCVFTLAHHRQARKHVVSSQRSSQGLKSQITAAGIRAKHRALCTGRNHAIKQACTCPAVDHRPVSSVGRAQDS